MDMKAKSGITGRDKYTNLKEKKTGGLNEKGQLKKLDPCGPILRIKKPELLEEGGYRKKTLRKGRNRQERRECHR